MALSAEELAKLEKKLKDIEKLADQLGLKFNSMNMRPLEDNMDAIDAIFNDFTKRVNDVNDDLGDLVNHFKKLVGEIGNSNEGIKATQSGFRKLGSLAEQLINHQKGLNNLSSEEVKNIDKKIVIELKRLETARKILAEEQEDLEAQLRRARARGEAEVKIQNLLDKNRIAQRNINELILDENKALTNTRDLVQRSADLAETFRKTMGLTGAAAGALKGILNTLGLGKLSEALGLDKAFEAASEKARELSMDRVQNLENEKRIKQAILDLEEDARILEQARQDLDKSNAGRQLAKEKRLQDEINAEKGILTTAQIRAGFGGKILKDKQAELDNSLKTNLANKQNYKDAVEANKQNLASTSAALQIEKDNLTAAKAKVAQYSLFGDKIQVINTYFIQAAKGLLKTFSDPLFYITLIVDAFKSLDNGISQFAKDMNLSYQDAAKLNNEFNDIANSSNDLFVTTKGIRETMAAIGQSLGTNAILNAKDAVTFTKLREQAGLTNEELSKMQQLTLATGGNLENNTKELLGAANITAMNNGVLLNEKEIMKEVARTSDATKLSLGGSAAALGSAVAQAKALGMTLEQVDKIADSLLQIESSISAELEAELLTGKNLNLENARLAALNNDMVGLAKELAKNYGTAAEFSKMNRIQQEAAAKAVGMSREELAGTLVKAEALKSMSGEQAELAKRAFDNRVKEVGLEQAQSELKKGQLDKMMAQQSIQERFNQSIEKLKEIFISLVSPLMPVLDIFAEILKPVGMIAGFIGQITKEIGFLIGPLVTIYGIFKGMQLLTKGMVIAQVALNSLKAGELTLNSGILSSLTFQNAQIVYKMAKEEGITGIKLVQAVMEETILGSIIAQGAGIIKNIAIGAVRLAQSIATAAAELMGVSALTLGIGTAVAVAAAIAGVAVLKSMTADDMVSPGYGKRTLMGPEGAIALNDKDTVLAGTNLFDKKENNTATSPSISPSQSSPSLSIDYTALANAIVSALSASPMNVNVRGEINGKTLVDFIGNNATNVGTAINTGTSKIS
jgi:galactitol-specific phosphotransferase system IIB component